MVDAPQWWGLQSINRASRALSSGAVDPPGLNGQVVLMLFRLRGFWQFRSSMHLSTPGARREVPSWCGGLCLLLLTSAVSCAGQSHEAHSAIGVTTEAELGNSDPPPVVVEKEVPPEDVVNRAALPFSGYRVEDKLAMSDEEMLSRLASADAICIGERHDQPIDHYAQFRALSGFLERRKLRGFELAIGMEMVRDENQSILTAYQSGHLTDDAFEVASRWEQQWGFPIQFYRPQMRLALHHQVEMLALGVDQELTRQVAAGGIESLDDESWQELPEIDANNQEHRQLFDELMAGHPKDDSGGSSLDNYYSAQLIWDEAMAEKSAAWLKARAPARKLLIFAGVAHCHRSAIPSRIERRGTLEVVSLLPVPDGEVRQAKGDHARLVAGYDYQMVFKP